MGNVHVWQNGIEGNVIVFLRKNLIHIIELLVIMCTYCLQYKKYWFDKDWINNLQVKCINKRILKMRPPDFLTRLPRDMEKHFKNLKGVYFNGTVN